MGNGINMLFLQNYAKDNTTLKKTRYSCSYCCVKNFV